MNSISSSFLFNAMGIIVIYLFIVAVSQLLNLYAKHKKLENNSIVN